MAMLARVVVPEIPHHVTQRWNRRQAVFFRDADYQEYRDLDLYFNVIAPISAW